MSTTVQQCVRVRGPTWAPALSDRDAGHSHRQEGWCHARHIVCESGQLYQQNLNFKKTMLPLRLIFHR